MRPHQQLQRGGLSESEFEIRTPGITCTCKLVDGGGSSMGSPALPSVASVTLARVLAANSLSGTGSCGVGAKGEGGGSVGVGQHVGQGRGEAYAHQIGIMATTVADLVDAEHHRAALDFQGSRREASEATEEVHDLASRR